MTLIQLECLLPYTNRANRNNRINKTAASVPGAGTHRPSIWLPIYKATPAIISSRKVIAGGLPKPMGSSAVTSVLRCAQRSATFPLWPLFLSAASKLTFFLIAGQGSCHSQQTAWRNCCGHQCWMSQWHLVCCQWDGLFPKL
jgi:hypothetical protein